MNSSRSSTVDDLRAAIDRLDERILELLRERARLAQEIGRQKGREGHSMYVPEREKQVLERILGLPHDPLPPAAVRSVFREIMSACLGLEQVLRIAYLGPEGTYCEQAVLDHFGSTPERRPVGSIDEVFEAVERGVADYGVVPVENSTQGVVPQTLDRFVSTPLSVRAEIVLRIDHCLLAAPETRKVRRVVAHAQSLAQCREWLARHHPGVALEAVASNAVAARLAAEQRGVAAIAGRKAAQRYGLRVLAASIQDQPDNFTRFVVVGRQASAEPGGDDKTSIVFAVPHQPGALHRVLEPFARNGVNLGSIESRPMKGRPWEYLFFADLSGHVRDPAVRRALRAVEKRTLFLKVLGSYPAWRPVDTGTRDGA